MIDQPAHKEMPLIIQRIKNDTEYLKDCLHRQNERLKQQKLKEAEQLHKDVQAFVHRHAHRGLRYASPEQAIERFNLKPIGETHA